MGRDVVLRYLQGDWSRPQVGLVSSFQQSVLRLILANSESFRVHPCKRLIAPFFSN